MRLAAVILFLFTTIALAEDGLHNPGAQKLGGQLQNPGSLGGGGGPTGCASAAIGGLLDLSNQCIHPGVGP